MNKKQKKLLLLGGLRYLIPVIKAAHELGHYVITCDYLPDNIAHKYSDEYHNVSITDKEAVLELAGRLRIDGIMSFAVDPGVITAAYVSQQMGLPGNPYESIYILQNKERFRKFLADNGFRTPKAKGYTCTEEALADVPRFNWPVIVKPVDSAGSKGVTKVEQPAQLEPAVRKALEASLSKKYIIEEFISQKGFSSDSDAFSVNGELKFLSFSDQRFDIQAENPYTPSAYSWPSSMNQENQNELKKEIQRLLKLLNMRTSIYNIETRVGTDGKPYIMEVSPRGGGNRLSEMLRYATGTDLIKNAVKAAVGEQVEDIKMPEYKKHWAEIILHADKEGRFEGLKIDESVKSHIRETDLWVKEGDQVNAFKGANHAIGTLVLEFNSNEEVKRHMENMKEWLKIYVE